MSRDACVAHGNVPGEPSLSERYGVDRVLIIIIIVVGCGDSAAMDNARMHNTAAPVPNESGRLHLS